MVGAEPGYNSSLLPSCQMVKYSVEKVYKGQLPTEDSEYLIVYHVLTGTGSTENQRHTGLRSSLFTRWTPVVLLANYEFPGFPKGAYICTDDEMGIIFLQH